MNSIQITVVIDNNSQREDLPAEHGLCLHVQSKDQTLIFDAGRSTQVLQNLATLGLDKIAPSWIALSHGHYDHTTGVPAMLQKYPEAKLHFHPKLLEPKWILDPDHIWRYGGVPLQFYQLPSHYLNPKRCSMELIAGVYASGSVAGDRAQSFSPTRFYRNPCGYTVVDAFPDEQVLLIKSERGLSILSGCMHTGLEATIKRARELFPETPFNALVGGLHLDGKSEEEFSSYLEILKKFNFQKVMPLHCTGQGFIDYLSDKSPSLLQKGFVGSTLSL